MFFATVTVSSEAYGRALTASGAQGARSPSEPGTESAAPSSSGSSSSESAPHACNRRALSSTLRSHPGPRFSPASLDFLLLAPPPPAPGVKVVWASAEEAARGETARQSRCCVLDLGSRITVDFLPFSCYPPPRSRPGSGTVKYPPAASTTRTARS